MHNFSSKGLLAYMTINLIYIPGLHGFLHWISVIKMNICLDDSKRDETEGIELLVQSAI